LGGNPRARAEPDVFYVQGGGGIDGWTDGEGGMLLTDGRVE